MASAYLLPPSYRFDDSRATTTAHRGLIVSTLSTSPAIYWGKQRTPEMIHRQLERAWRNICVIHEGETGEEELVGFSRVVSDGEAFATFTDLFILPEHGGKGLAKALAVETVENSKGPGGSSHWKWVLFTQTAHKLYSTAVGFARPSTTGWAMLRLPPDDPTPLPARPLPPSYHLDPTKGASYKHFPTIYSALVHNEAVYWDRDRTEDVVRGQIESAWSTVCVIKTTAAGEQELAGWCRVISDGEEFAYLEDVVILAEHGKRGLAKALVQEAVENSGGPGVSNGWKWFLWTGDAHKLYESVAGFKQLPADGRVMERVPPGEFDMH